LNGAAIVGKRYLVVMTACIDPSRGWVKVPRGNPEVRLRDYQSALAYWLRHPDPRLRDILFLDNSGYSLDALREQASKQNPNAKKVEFLSFSCNEYPQGVHYGYAELALLDSGLAKSELAAECLYFVKATGRFTFPRISRLLDRLPADFWFAIDCRHHRLGRNAQRVATTQLMLFATAFYRENLCGIKHLLGPPPMTHIENLFYQQLIPFRGDPRAILRWPVSVDPAGVSAFGKDYGSLAQRLKNRARGVLRVLAPGWWV
jgi:hypothetical protein